MFFSKWPKSLKVLDGQLRSHQKKVKLPGRMELVAQDLKYVEDDLLSDAPASRRNLADTISRLGTWYAIDGLVALGKGNAAGWGDIHRSWLYEALANRIHVLTFGQGRVLGRFRSPKTLESEAIKCALCLAYAMTFGDEAKVNFFGDVIRVMISDRNVVPMSHWRHHWTEPFMVWLLDSARKDKSAQCSDWKADLGPYQGIIDAWDQPARLTDAICHACEFHCQRIEDDSDKFTAEFLYPPFDLIPVEILAIYAVRKSLGLESPRIEHPLFRGLFATPVGNPSEIEDALLNRVEASL